jgi:putative transposase
LFTDIEMRHLKPIWIDHSFGQAHKLVNVQPMNMKGRMQAAMAKKKRHSRVEIASKLAQANDLARQGKLQREIARTLGVSVMTLHRWRKAPPGPQPALVATHDTGQSDRTPAGGNRIAELQLENSRLRRLVTDLLLEKIKLDEAAQSQKFSSDGRKRASR